MADTPLTEEEQQSRRAAVAQIMPSTPYLKSLGIVMEVFEPDHARIRLPFREDLTNDGAVYHGGVVAAVLDTAGAAAAWSNHDFDKGARASTVSMTVQYLGACKKSDLVCEGRALRRGRELIFCEMTATDADGKLVANGVLTYRIV